MAEDIEQEALATLVVNKLRGSLKIAALKAPGFGERKSQYLDDIANLTGGTVIREEVGLTLDKDGNEVLGTAAKVVLTKDTTTIAGDGSTQEAVTKRVSQIKNQIEAAEQDYEKEKLSERIAKLSGGVAVIQVGLTLDKAGNEVLGTAAKVVLTKDTTTIAGDGSTQEAVTKRVSQIKNQIEAAEQDYEKEKLSERIAKLSGGVAVIQVGAQTETELKEKKLRVEDALNATKAAVEEGIVVGGGCTLLRLSSKVDATKSYSAGNHRTCGNR
ncbi:hypothetical protein KIW84_010739, partial [Lathyrus oleraceus]